MFSLHHNESNMKNTWQPRHPIVCILDIIGATIIFLLLLRSTSGIVQLYLFSIVLLYLTSMIHHWLPNKHWSRLLDHIMIFVVIAFSALPYWVAYPPLQWKPEGYIIIISIILLGTVVKLISYFSKHISALLYTLAGLPMVAYFLWHWSDVPSPYNTLWLVGVGVYVLQMFIYTFHWFDFKKRFFGFQEVQHIFLLIATTLHASIALQLVG